MVECFPNMHKTLGSIPAPPFKKKTKQNKMKIPKSIKILKTIKKLKQQQKPFHLSPFEMAIRTVLHFENLQR